MGSGEWRDFPFSILHLSFVIGGTERLVAMANDKINMENGKSPTPHSLLPTPLFPTFLPARCLQTQAEHPLHQFRFGVGFIPGVVADILILGVSAPHVTLGGGMLAELG